MEKLLLIGQSPITRSICAAICTDIHDDDFALLTTLTIKDKNRKAAVRLLFSIADQGYSVIDILEEYFAFISAFCQKASERIFL